MNRIAIALLALGLAAAPAEAQRSIDERRPLSADGRVQIATISRDLAVVAWDRNEVHVTGQLDDQYERLVIDGARGEVSIRVEPIRNRRHSGRDSEGPIEVRVPAGAAVSARTVSGDIAARGFRGTVDLSSTSGDIDVTGRPRSVRVESVSGDLDVDGARESVHASAVSGDMRLRTSGEYVNARTVSGDLDMSAAEPVKNGTLKSVSGDIDFRGSLAPSAVLELESHSGEITLMLPANVSARFDLTTFSGSIANAFGPAPERTSRYTPEKSLSFTTGNGDARIVVKTFSGEVRLEKN